MSSFLWWLMPALKFFQKLFKFFPLSDEQWAFGLSLAVSQTPLSYGQTQCWNSKCICSFTRLMSQNVKILGLTSTTMTIVKQWYDEFLNTHKRKRYLSVFPVIVGTICWYKSAPLAMPWMVLFIRIRRNSRRQLN